MPISATGKPPTRPAPRRQRRAWGFTLLELMIVVAIAGIASAAVALALRDSRQSQLDREALRLVALLESARAQSRATGVSTFWRATATGFEFSTGPQTQPGQWDDAATQASSPTPVPLGPEPVIGPQQVRLWSRDAPERSLWLRTDGLRAFAVYTTP